MRRRQATYSTRSLKPADAAGVQFVGLRVLQVERLAAEEVLVNAPGVRAFWALPPGQQLWFGIQPLSAAVFGVPLGFLVTWGVSLLTRRSS